jgi:broad specificity phosphatase PhoE
MKRTRNLASAVMGALGMDGPDDALREIPVRTRTRPHPRGARRQHPDSPDRRRKRPEDRRHHREESDE